VSIFDVVIAGGGLAGLCLARQLKLEAPDLRILVVEKRRHPVREAAFKVGESSVEIGAHYFETILGLGPHLRGAHLEKLGLRYFFPHEGNREIHRRVELGPSMFPPVPSFQLDRGRLENYLLDAARASGVEVEDGASVKAVIFGEPHHAIDLEGAGGLRRAHSRWIVDASGRAGLIKRQLGLARAVGHGANASWFRIKSRLRVDDWSSDPSWQSRVGGGLRWQSTNHLMGRGYWVWLIPLGSGSTSVGIVADGDIHPFARINRLERAIEWLREFEPQCADVVEAHAGEVEDFLALRHYAHGCARVFSPDRWALVGEAGVFTDPFYSPGSDFIALGNDYVTDLIVRQTRGEDIAVRASRFDETYRRLFDAFLRLYEGQYALMGNAQVMTAKAAWDNASYWAITALLFFQRRYRRPEFIASIDDLLRRFFPLHVRMQRLFRAWDLADSGSYADAFTNLMRIDELRALQAALAGPLLDDEVLRRRLESNFELLERLARGIQALAAGAAPSLDPALCGTTSAGDLLNIEPLRIAPRRAAIHV
jgi:flavin-dependent dehydrogenase